MDTLKFEISSKNFDYNELLDLMKIKFEFVSNKTFKYGESINYKYKNWLFWLTRNKLTAVGSITKLFFGNNLVNISFNEIKLTLDSLYEILNFDISDATIKQVDVGFNFIMNNEVNCYLDILTTPIGFKAWKLSNESLYFKKNDKALEFVFYDKFKEVKSKDNIVTSGNENILRYELKLRKNIKEILGDDSLVSLYNYDTYLKLVNVWHDSYLSIPKITQPLSSKIQLGSKKSLTDWLIKEGIKANGGIEVICNVITNSKLDKMVRWRLRELLKSIDAIEYLNPKLKEELDDKIEAIYQHQQAA